MPLVRIEVRNEFALGVPELYTEANKEDPKEILEGVSVAGLVGVLRQLGDLAEFAGEVFHGLQEEVTMTSSRSRKLMDRVQRIEAALSPLEKAVLAQKSHLHFAYTAGSNWHARIRCRKSHFLYSEMPQFIMDSYEDCHDLPNLHLLDKFDAGGPGSCLKRYSDPTFFKRASVASGEVNAKKISKDKKGRRVKTRRSWAGKRDVLRDASFSYNNGRMQFTQLNIGGHPSPTQTATTFRSELDEQLNLDLRNGSVYTEGDSRPSYSVHAEEQESRESMSSPVIGRNSDFLDYDFLREKITDAYDDFNMPQEQTVSSPPVPWDGKGETIDHITRESNDDGMILENDNGHLEPFSLTLDPETVGNDALDFETLEQMDVQPQAVLALERSDAHLDDIESETDHFMDALNTIESEGDSDVDWGKKQELQQYSELQDDRAHDNGVCQPMRHNLECQFSSYGSNILVNDSLTVLPDTSYRDLDSVSPKSQCETNGSISGVAKDEFSIVSLDERVLQSSQTDAMPSTTGSMLQAEDEYNAILVADKTLKLSQTDAMPSTPGSLLVGKDEFNSVSLVDRTLKSSETYAMPSTAGSPFPEKDEFNSVSLVDRTLKSSETYAMPSTAGSPFLEKDEFNSVSLVDNTLETYAMPSTAGRPLLEEDELRSVSLVDNTLQSSQTDAMSSTPGSLLQEKDELNTVSLVDKILQSSQTDAMSSIPGSPLCAKDDSNSVFLDEVLQSSQTDAMPSIPGSPLQAKDELDSVSLLDKTLESPETDRLSVMRDSPQSVDSQNNGCATAGNNGESLSCAVSPNFQNDGSRTPITDRTMSSLESQKPASDTSSVASVTFWTNGGLLGLQPSKPPDFSASNGTPQDPVYKKDEKVSSSDQSENLKNNEEVYDMNRSNGHEYQESSTSLRKPSWKFSPADLNIDLSKLGNSLHSNTSSIGSSATASGNLLPVNSVFQAIRKYQEYNGTSSQIFGLGNRFRPNGSNKKLLPGGDENLHTAEYQHASNFEQKNQQNAAHCTYSGQNKDLCAESPLLSPSSSPPLQHMKISFQPMEGFETSKLKLKFPEGNNSSRSVSDIFPSFQLVPEASITQHNVGYDSDADEFYRSSPSLSDDCQSIQSESNSGQWESSESPPSKHHELYDSLRRISLTESVSSVPEKGRINLDDIHDNCGFPSVGIGLKNSESSQMFDHQSLGSLSHSFRKELRNGTFQKDLVKPQFEPSPDLPSFPPVQWRGMTPHLDGKEGQRETMLEDSYCGFQLKHSSSTISQPKPAPSNGDHIGTTTLQKRKSTSETNGQKEAHPVKNIDDKGDFLHQIRMKSFNLRPTFIDKPTVPPPEASAHVQVTAILEKANAIRQAVGSDEEDDGTWSDT